MSGQAEVMHIEREHRNERRACKSTGFANKAQVIPKERQSASDSKGKTKREGARTKEGRKARKEKTHRYPSTTHRLLRHSSGKSSCGRGNRGQGGTRWRVRPGGGGAVGLSKECVHIHTEHIEELPQQWGCTKVQTRAAELELEAGEFGGEVGMQTVERVVVLGVYHGLQSAVSVVDTFGAEIFDLGPYLADHQKGLIHVGLNALCSRYNTAIAIILESGAVYCAAPIFLLITLSLENAHLNVQLYSIIGLGIVQQLINIIPTFTLVYIGLKNTTGGIGQVPSNSEWILNRMGLKKKNTRVLVIAGSSQLYYRVLSITTTTFVV
ncbi:hypothetical protein B0H13DRAFT_2294105 [Mycena leptocephala]|nr:hypothetical protein B0H13DRAFT_2294105 [Mycena leptocephala]